MANRVEIVSDYTKLAILFEEKNYAAIGKVIYTTLATANGTTPDEERKKILTPFASEEE
ncbi:MAG: hypothetical protein FWG83_00585 [Oscillospiraceae bacterium]|nr:hypothetical protein [Oscillospiraceae bacterium]